MSYNMQNMINIKHKTNNVTWTWKRIHFVIFLYIVYLLISTEIPHNFKLTMLLAREDTNDHQPGMWFILKLKGMRWPTRFQRSKKGFVFWSLISGILLTQTWQRDCLRNTKSFSFIIFVSSSLLFFAGFVNVTSNIDEEDKENGFARISLLFFTISRDIKENYEAQIRPAHFNIFKFVTIRVSFIHKKRDRCTPPPRPQKNDHVWARFWSFERKKGGRGWGNLIGKFIF